MKEPYNGLFVNVSGNNADFTVHFTVNVTQHYGWFPQTGSADCTITCRNGSVSISGGAASALINQNGGQASCNTSVSNAWVSN